MFEEPEMEECTYCGAMIKVGALNCKECGSDFDTGWSEGPDESSLDADFDYDKARADEFGIGKKNDFPVWVIVTGLIMLVLFVLGYLL